MSEYVTYPIQELLEQGILFIGDGYRAKNSELDSHGLPFARGANINNGFLFDDADRFPIESLSRVGNKVSQAGDVVFTSKGTVGRFAFVDENIEQFVYSPQLCFWRVLDTDWIEPRYLFYWMNGREFYLQYSGVKGQTDMADYVSLTDQRRMFITLPPLDEQRAIAEILGSLDDKIEANRRQNETLVATARAIFKSWFVDFDPVHHKSRGEHPLGIDAETAALFPDSFEDSELGLIPCGWRVVPIGDAVKAVGGSTPSTAEPAFWDDGTIHWATPKDLSNLSSPVLLDTDRQITDMGLQQISSGLLPKGTLLLSSRAPVGYLAIAEIPVAINQGFIAMICDEGFPSLYALFWTEANLDVIKNRASGTTFQEISKRNFRPILALVPSFDVLRGFVEIVEPLCKQVVCNLKEARTLAETRDTLLPRLVSGELRVGEV